ncbi:unnamed protein product [Linum trigynum]|uniref:RNase H type-1 domain-containing protein n=1 Tax=Linum trigynum TaxID=586398 RepID=A0AAV2F5Y7_9ROSI
MKRLLNILHQDHLFMTVTAVLWRIWRSRNWVVFEGKQFGIPALMRQYHQQYQEWISLSVGKSQGGPAPPEVEVPHFPMICLWDGATMTASHSAGGMVVKNHLGDILIAIGFQFAGIEDSLVAEALALREAILWCRDSGFVEVRFEGDAKVLIEKINQANTRDSRVGALLEEIVGAFGSMGGFSVRFVGRRSNRVAHLVARNALHLYPTTSRSFDFLAWLNSRM